MSRKTKLQLKPFRQSPAYCGPASLKIALAYLGKRIPEKKLARLCRTTKKHGTLHRGMVRGAKATGVRVIAKQKSTIRDMRDLIQKKKLPIIVGWYDTSGKEGDHYSVIYHVSKNFIYLMDPATKSGYRKMSIKKFLERWFDFEGTDRARLIERWMMVATLPTSQHTPHIPS